VGSAIKGGDIATGAEIGAVGGALGSAFNAAKTYQKALSDAYKDNYTPLLKETQTAQNTLDKAINDTTYSQAYKDAQAAENAVKTVYNNDFLPLQKEAQPLYEAAKLAEKNYNEALTAFKATPLISSAFKP
jgi:hypothetical protein